MKRIIAFVILGVMIYAGIYILVYGIENHLAYSDKTVHDFNSMSPNMLQANILVSGYVDSLSEYITEDGYRYDSIHVDGKTILGITVYGDYDLYIYLTEVGYEENWNDKKYCLLAIRDSDKENLEIAKQLLEEEHDGVSLKFSGVMAEDSYVSVRQSSPFSAKLDDEVLPYIIYVGGNSDAFDFMPVIIVGGAVTLTGAGLTLLLILKIKRDRESY